MKVFLYGQTLKFIFSDTTLANFWLHFLVY